MGFFLLPLLWLIAIRNKWLQEGTQLSPCPRAHLVHKHLVSSKSFRILLCSSIHCHTNVVLGDPWVAQHIPSSFAPRAAPPFILPCLNGNSHLMWFSKQTNFAMGWAHSNISFLQAFVVLGCGKSHLSTNSRNNNNLNHSSMHAKGDKTGWRAVAKTFSAKSAKHFEVSTPQCHSHNVPTSHQQCPCKEQQRCLLPPHPWDADMGGGGTWIWGQLTHPTPLATHGVFLPGSKGVQPRHTLSMLESRQHESAQRHYNFSSHLFMLSGQEHPMLSQQKSSLVRSKLRFSSIDPSSWSWRHLFSQSQYSASQ